VCSREEVRAALDAILETPEFARSESICRLLEHVVANTLEGRAADLKEYNLGVEVFRRGNDFDPRVDNIVRVQARRLRQRLAAYYAAPRTGVRIEMPTGSYVPGFRRIETVANGGSSGADAFHVIEAAPRGLTSHYRYGAIAIGAAACFLAGFVCARKLPPAGSTHGTPVMLIPLVTAGGDSEEVRAAALVSQLVRTRFSGMDSLRLVKARPPVGFTIEGSARRMGNRIALTLSLWGDREQRGHGLRCSLIALDDVAAAESLAGMLAERMAGHVRDLLEGNPRRSPAWGRAAADFDAGGEFAAHGPAASYGPWSYGWEKQLSGPFQLYLRAFQVKYWGIGVTGWSDSGEGPQNGHHCCPFIAKNTSGQDLREQIIAIPANQLWFHPGDDGEFSVVRWQSNAVGRYWIEARFSALSFTSTDVHVLKHGAPLMDGVIDGPGVWHDVLIRNLTCEPKDPIDFAVGVGADGDNQLDITGLDVRIGSMESGP
jgi:hypothetical protein